MSPRQDSREGGPRRAIAVFGVSALIVAAVALRLARVDAPAYGGAAPDDAASARADVPVATLPAGHDDGAGVLPPAVVGDGGEPLVAEVDALAEGFDRWRAELERHHDADTRAAAAEALAAWVPGDGEAPLIAAAATDDVPEVREAALRALEGGTSPAVVAAFAAALSDTEAWVQDAGETGLYRHDDRIAAVRALAALCTSADRDLRIRAAELLDEMDAGPIEWDLIDAGPVLFAWVPPDPDDH